jgi:Lung seven transmembrane receptor
MPLQFWITLVLALGMVETTILFGKYLNWNDYGSPAMAVTFVALFFGVLKVSAV